MSKIGTDIPRKRRRWRIAAISIGVVAFLVGGSVALYAWSLAQAWDNKTEKIADAFPSDDTRPPVAAPATGQNQPQNILLLGSDTRGSVGDSIAGLSGQRSDSIMVAHIPADRSAVYVMSVMRDSWVEIPGHGYAKINAALSLGGVPLAVQTIEGMLGARMDHVAVIDFNGFVGVTDALGGVSIDNPIAFQSSHLKGHFYPQGPQNMNGEEALAFVRERYAFSDGDFQRVRNQRQFIKAVMSTILTPETLTSPKRVTDLVGAIAPHLAVDEGLNSGYVAKLGSEIRNVRVDNVTFFGAPTDGTGTSPDGQSIVNVDWDEIAKLKEAFASDQLHLYTPGVPTPQ
ncbi:MAG TPA: LCP family protein [Glaciibacter sp.]|nr:LCP family protein [Glaciibacter sp.]